MVDDKPFLFPVVIDDTSEYTAKVPERFRERQWTRLIDDDQITAFAEQMAGLLLKQPSPAQKNPEAPRPDSPGASKTSTDESSDGFWIAVLPFRHIGASSELEAIAEGLCEEIVTGLSRFSYLRVISHGSTTRLKNQFNDASSAGKSLNARYVMQGSLRQSGSRLRIAAQLVDTSSGAHLWAESYDRTYSPDAVFELQDELVPRIVSTVADQNGILPRSMSEVVRNRPPESLSPYEAVLRSFAYFWRLTAEECEASRCALELALQKAPDDSDAWAMLALLSVQAHAQRFNPEIDFLPGGLAAARRAVESGPSNHMAHFSHAQALYFAGETESFRNSAIRTVELNPLDGNAIAFMGELLSYSGEFDRGKTLAKAAKELNPNHPGWYWITDFYHAYRERDYRLALSCSLRIELPEHWGTYLAIAASSGQLGDLNAGRQAMRQLLEFRPNFAKTGRADLERWFGTEYTEHILDGLRKAGFREETGTTSA